MNQKHRYHKTRKIAVWTIGLTLGVFLLSTIMTGVMYINDPATQVIDEKSINKVNEIQSDMDSTNKGNSIATGDVTATGGKEVLLLNQ